MGEGEGEGLSECSWGEGMNELEEGEGLSERGMRKG